MTKVELLEKIKQYKTLYPFHKDQLENRGQGLMPTWERKLMLDIGAIKTIIMPDNCEKESDVVSADYPMLTYLDGKGIKNTFDAGGNVRSLEEKKRQLESNGSSAWIEYMPKAFSEYVNLKDALDKDELHLKKLGL